MTCILLVEDDDDVRDTLDGVFSSRGFSVLLARNGMEALEQVRRYGARPSVIVLDLMMPRMNGEEFLAVQANEPLLVHVPVILQTAQLYVPDPLPSAVTIVLHKPMHLGDLLLAIDRCLIDAPTAPPPLAHGTGALPPITSPPAAAPDETPEPDAPAADELAASPPTTDRAK